jgi:chromosome segregation ATPase
MSTTDRGVEPPAGETEQPGRRRNRWIWVSAVLAVVAAGSLIWALTIRSDLDATEKKLDTANAELETAQQELAGAQQDVEDLQAQAEEDADDGANAGGIIVAGGALYKQFADQLGATQEDLAATQQDLEAAQQAAEQADEAAAAAEQRAADAGNETEQAQAEAEQARAQADAAEAHAAVAADCAKAFIGAFGGLFEGEDVQEQARVVREQLEEIVAGCEKELAG